MSEFLRSASNSTASLVLYAQKTPLTCCACRTTTLLMAAAPAMQSDFENWS